MLMLDCITRYCEVRASLGYVEISLFFCETNAWKAEADRHGAGDF
jgi:hypothetical protein